MNKWADMDSDIERLPAGFERIGYDADEQTYTFRAPDGRIYESEPGNRYGKLWPVDEARPQRTEAEIQAQNAAIEKGSRESTRMMLPFALLVFVVLFLLFRLVDRNDSDDSTPHLVHCAEGSHKLQVRQNDTCWAIAEEYHLHVDDLLKLSGNEAMDCKSLRVGQILCVPDTHG